MSPPRRASLVLLTPSPGAGSAIRVDMELLPGEIEPPALLEGRLRGHPGRWRLIVRTPRSSVYEPEAVGA